MKNLIISLSILYCLQSCENKSITQQAQAKNSIDAENIRDSVRRQKELEEKVDDIYYDFKSDPIRQKWVAQHTLMCYKSKSYMAQTCGYDENGNRVTNQILGVKEADNAFCINRRTKVITWYTYKNGQEKISEYFIKQIDELRKFSSFGVKDKTGKKYVFNVPDEGQKITILDEDHALTFFLSNDL